MAFQRYRLRSELPNTALTQSYLNKIAADLAQGPSTRVVFEIGFDRFSAHDCTNVTITGTGTIANISFQRPGGSIVEHYDLADIENIRRLRTKKHLIVIKAGSNPA
jgi:hypothetical protein